MTACASCVSEDEGHLMAATSPFAFPNQPGQRRAESRDLLRAAFQRWGGHEVDTQGDAFFVAFARATDALSAAVAAQHALASHPWPEGVSLRVRMGLHTGE